MANQDSYVLADHYFCFSLDHNWLYVLNREGTPELRGSYSLLGTSPLCISMATDTVGTVYINPEVTGEPGMEKRVRIVPYRSRINALQIGYMDPLATDPLSVEITSIGVIDIMDTATELGDLRKVDQDTTLGFSFEKEYTLDGSTEKFTLSHLYIEPVSLQDQTYTYNQTESLTHEFRPSQQGLRVELYFNLVTG